MAAGLRMHRDHVDAFRHDLVEFINERLSAEDLVRAVTIDATCTLADVSVELWEQIEKLAPFGRSNPPPTFCVRDVRIERTPMRLGAEGKHLLRWRQLVHVAQVFLEQRQHLRPGNIVSLDPHRGVRVPALKKRQVSSPAVRT